MIGNNMIGSISTIDGKRTLTISFNDADPIGDNFGLDEDVCNVNEVIEAVRDLYREEIRIDGFDFSIPIGEQIRVDYVTESIETINITFPANVGDGTYNVVALNQLNGPNIFMTYPILNNCMSARQILSHELGHWFLNRAIEHVIEVNNLDCSRHVIEGYEDNISERAAHYCEIRIAGYRKIECYIYRECEMACEIKKAIHDNDRYLRLRMRQCLREMGLSDSICL